MKREEIITEKQKHGTCLNALDLKKHIEMNFLELGAMLYQIKTQRLYEAGWESWEEYEMELKLPASTISRLIRIYEIFELRFKIAPAQLAKAGWTVVAEFLPDVSKETTKEQVESWMGDAVLMPRTDLRRTIVERRRGTDMAKCKHHDTYKIEVCRNCGDRWKI